MSDTIVIAIIAAASAIAGTVAGALITGLVTAINERHRRAHEERQTLRKLASEMAVEQYRAVVSAETDKVKAYRELMADQKDTRVAGMMPDLPDMLKFYSQALAKLEKDGEK